MSHPVTSVNTAQAEAPPTFVRPKAPDAKVQSVPTDTVQISSAAVAALKEVTETHFQTAKEASAGDQQAVRLLQKEQAAAAHSKK